MGTNAERKSPRYRVELDARVRLAGTFFWLAATVSNLSKSGICLQTKTELVPAQLIEIEINTVDVDGRDHRRLMSGTIQWRRGQRYGVRFL